MWYLKLNNMKDKIIKFMQSEIGDIETFISLAMLSLFAGYFIARVIL